MSMTVPLARLEDIIDRSGVTSRIEALLPIGVRPRQLKVRTLLAGMLLTQADHRPAHLTRVHQSLASLPDADRIRLGVLASWKHGPHLLTYRQVERTFGLVVTALQKEHPDGAPSPVLETILDALLEASIPPGHKDTTRALAVDWSDLETFSRPPPAIGGDCADPEASWGHRHGDGPGQKDELFYGYYVSAGTMVKEENSPAVPELARRMTLTTCQLDPAQAMATVLQRMPADGIPLGDVLDDSGYAHRVPGNWAVPLRAAGAQLIQDLMGTWQATATRALGVMLFVQSAGPVCQIDACPGLSTWMPWCREAGSGRRGWCRVTRTVDQGTRSFCGDPGPGISPPPPACQRHAGPHPRKALFVTVWVIVA